MALAIDATSSTNGVAANTITLSHTTSGSDRGLIVGVSLTAAQTVTGVTYNSVAMTQEATDSHSLAASLKVYIFSLIAPASGTNDVVVTCSGASNVVVGAISFTGADQTTLADGATNTEGNTSPATISVTSATGEIVVDAVNVNAGPTLTVGSGQTEQWQAVQSGTGAGSTEAGASSVTMSWTFSNNIWVQVALSVNAAAGGATTNVDLSLTVTSALALLKQAVLARSIGGSASPAIVKGVNNNERVTVTGVTANTFSAGKLLGFTTTSSLSVVVSRAFLVALSLTVTSALQIVKSVGNVAGVTTLSVIAEVFSVSKTLALGVSGAPAATKQVAKSFALTVTSALAVTVTFIAAAVTAGKNRLVGLIRGVGLAGRP